MAAPPLTPYFGVGALVLTAAAFVTRAASLVRNARLKTRSTLQSAIGIKHPRIVQKAQGMMGGAFNTREFCHGRSRALIHRLEIDFGNFERTFRIPAEIDPEKVEARYEEGFLQLWLPKQQDVPCTIDIIVS